MRLSGRVIKGKKFISFWMTFGLVAEWLSRKINIWLSRFTIALGGLISDTFGSAAERQSDQMEKLYKFLNNLWSCGWVAEQKIKTLIVWIYHCSWRPNLRNFWQCGWVAEWSEGKNCKFLDNRWSCGRVTEWLNRRIKIWLSRFTIALGGLLSENFGNVAEWQSDQREKI